MFKPEMWFSSTDYGWLFDADRPAVFFIGLDPTGGWRQPVRIGSAWWEERTAVAEKIIRQAVGYGRFLKQDLEDPWTLQHLSSGYLESGLLPPRGTGMFALTWRTVDGWLEQTAGRWQREQLGPWRLDK